MFEFHEDFLKAKACETKRDITLADTVPAIFPAWSDLNYSYLASISPGACPISVEVTIYPPLLFRETNPEIGIITSYLVRRAYLIGKIYFCAIDLYYLIFGVQPGIAIRCNDV